MAPTAASIVSGWRIQARNIHALMIRDLMARYGRDNIGFVWFVVEPILLSVGITFVWLIVGLGKQEGVKVVELVLTGYVPLTLWRHMTGPIIHVFRGSRSLLYHRRISLFDLVLARLLLEFLGATVALLLYLGTLVLTGAVEGVESMDYFVLGWFMMAWIGTAMGMLIAVASELSETAVRFINPLQYLNLPISGCFIMVDWLPPAAQKAIMYHPMVHCYEVFRHGYFGDTVPTHYDIAYFVVCAFVLTFFAFVAMFRVRSRVEV
jgi:capsular polysaccharide transport system permease protein